MQILELGRQHMQGIICPGVITPGSWLPSLSFSTIFDQISADVLFGGSLTYVSNFHVSLSASIPCVNMNGSEWGLKMQSEIY